MRASAGLDIDMRIDAALADQFQLRQPLQQRGPDRRALADQNQRLGVAQPPTSEVDVLHVSFQIVTSWPASFLKQSSVRSVSK